MTPDALVQQIKSQILVRKGDVVDEALAEERARNIVAALECVRVEEKKPRLGDPRLIFRFDDTNYRINHGGLPRGRGAWAFATGDKIDDHLWFSPGNLKLTDAKNLARAHFAQWMRNCCMPDGTIVTLYVMP